MSYAGKPYQPPGPLAPPQEATNPLGVVALVLGILSVFMGCPLAIGALITGWVGMKKEPSGMARAGFYIGLIMTIFHVVAGVAVLMFFVFVIGIAAIAESQDRATANSSSYPGSSYSESSSFDSSYGSPDIAPFPVSMPEPMEMPKMPDPYVPPSMPSGIDPASFPRSPDFGVPPNFGPGGMGPGGIGPPSGMGPGGPGAGFPPGAFPSGPGAYPGAFPPGLGPPTTMETLTPTPEEPESGFDP